MGIYLAINWVLNPPELIRRQARAGNEFSGHNKTKLNGDAAPACRTGRLLRYFISSALPIKQLIILSSPLLQKDLCSTFYFISNLGDLMNTLVFKAA